jgi:nitroreductase
MDIFDAMEKRFSCRKYLDKKVSEKDLLLLLDAGAKAPNAGNLQNWDFIVVDDEDKKEKLTKASLDQRWMMGAGVFIVLCSDSTPSKKFYPKRRELYDQQNCAAAAENILLMAASIGLGACWVGAFDKEAVSRTLKLPAHITPHIILTIGYSAEQEKSQRRMSLDSITHYNEYGNREKEQSLFREMKSALTSGMKALYQRIPRERKK